MTVTANLRRGRSQCCFCPQCHLVSSYRCSCCVSFISFIIMYLHLPCHVASVCSSRPILLSVSSSSSMAVGYGPMHYELPPTVRGGLCVHRPSDDCDDLVISEKRKLTAAAGSTRKRARPTDEHFLEYLTLRHQGNVETAQLSLLIASSAGRGKFHCAKNDNAVIPSTHVLHDSVPSSSVSAQARSH